MHPKHLSIKDYTYYLPDDKIARFPLAERDSSKLLVYNNEGMTSSNYSQLHSFLPATSLLIFNNTRVVEARLLFQKQSGATIEIFCLEPSDQYPDLTTGMQQKGTVYWKCLIGGAGKWKHGITLTKSIEGDTTITIDATIAEKLQDSFIIKLSWQPADLTFAEMLHEAGLVPLPPYLHREVVAADKERYQTVFARFDGSVAAPTAGLHFTPQVFDQFKNKGIEWQFVTLHVGAGTFKPVKSEIMQHHIMHAEFIDVSLDVIDTLAQQSRTIVAVGTTSLRTIESLYWMGVKIASNLVHDAADLVVQQWDPYELTYDIHVKDALSALAAWLRQRNLQRLITKTQIIIAPGYTFKIAKGLVTNFHQPQSTLLLLIAAITGDDWRKIYDYALQHDYRFLSYGDGCLLWMKETENFVNSQQAELQQ